MSSENSPAAGDMRHLEGRVGGVLRRHRMNLLATGACLVLAVFTAAFLGFSAADIVFKLEAGARVLFLGAAVCAAAALLVWRVLKPWLGLGGLLSVARSVERIHPQLEQQLSTALEFGGDKVLAERASSPELVGALVRQARERSQEVDFSRAVRWKALAVAALFAFLLGVGGAFYARQTPRLFKTTLKRFLNPFGATPPPRLTEIVKVEPGDAEVPVEQTVSVNVTVGGRVPENVTLEVWLGSPKDGRWEDRPLERDGDGVFRGQLCRLLETTRYKILAGDAEPPEYKIEVYRSPEISEFILRLEYPKYTGWPGTSLAPGVGDIRALKGTVASLELKANTELESGRIVFRGGAPEVALAIDPADKHKAGGSFKIDQDSEYQVRIANKKGSGASSLFSIKALPDRYPTVVIRKPEKDLMVHREQTVEVEISADDDVGVGEFGIFHSLELDETKVMVRRLDPATPHAEGKLVWELGHKGLKGGEVIAYYAYAVDNDTVSGPKMSKSDLHFLTVYDEEEYSSPQDRHKQPGAPEAVKQLDKIIEAQKKLLKETFAQARQKEANAAAEKPAPQAEKAAALKTAEAQKNLREKAESLLSEAKSELDRNPAPEPRATEGEGPKPPTESGLGSKELEHIERAAGKMAEAETQLKVPSAPGAVKPETEALRHLSETRRLLLSEEGDPRFKTAMENQARKNKQRENSQAQQDEEQAREEMIQLPKMMEREKQVERQLEELSNRRKNNPPPPRDRSQTQPQKQEQEAQRSLQRKNQQELEQLANESQERARKLDDLAARTGELQSSAEKMRQAASKLAQAAQDAGRQEESGLSSAQAQAGQARNDTGEAQRALRHALEKQIRQELANLQKDAQELASRQEEIAQKTNLGGENANKPLSPEDKQHLRALANEERDVGDGLREMGERLKNAARHAAEKDLAGGKELERAWAQAAEDAPAGKALQKAQGAMSAARAEEARREAAQAAKALSQVAETVQEGVQQAAAGDMKALAGAMKKLQALEKEQSDISNELGVKDSRENGPDQMAKPVPAGAVAAKKGALPEREEQVAGGAQDLANGAENLDTLRQAGRERNAREKLEEAAKQAAAAAEALKKQEQAAARSNAEKTGKSLAAALDEMERAAGKTMEEKGREAKNLAKLARTNQEKALDEVRQLAPAAGKLPPGGEAKLPAAAAKEKEAAREAAQLESALGGMENLAREANPPAAAAARAAHTLSENAGLPGKMENLAQTMAKLGNPGAPAPTAAAENGEKLNQTVREMEKELDNYLAETAGSQLDKLRSMEEDAREAARQAGELAQPGAQKNKEAQATAAERLQKELERLEPRLERLEAGSSELVKMREARAELQKTRTQAKKPNPAALPGDGGDNSGGPGFLRAQKDLSQVAGGLVNRIERILRARDIRPEEDEDAPKEYRVLVEKYYRALSEDVDEH